MVLTDVGMRKVATMADVRAAIARRPAGRDLVVRILAGDKAEFRVLLDPEARVRPPDRDP